jgi:hypothetical protein
MAWDSEQTQAVKEPDGLAHCQEEFAGSIRG